MILRNLVSIYSFKGGLSFNLIDVLVPSNKEELVKIATNKVDEIYESYQMGFITDKERFNQVVDIWTGTDNRMTNSVDETNH
jgi:DNA-directed RNA polymerase subunit beta'